MTPETADKLALQFASTLDTAVKVGAGTVLGAGLALLADRLKRGDERRKDARRRRQERIIDPIYSFVDDLLALISHSFWTSADRATATAEDKAAAEKEAVAVLSARLVDLRSREAIVEARVGSLGSSTLAKAFQELSAQLVQVRYAAENQGLGAARDETGKASDLGAKLFAILSSVEERELPKTPRAVTKEGTTLATLPEDFT